MVSNLISESGIKSLCTALMNEVISTSIIYAKIDDVLVMIKDNEQSNQISDLIDDYSQDVIIRAILKTFILCMQDLDLGKHTKKVFIHKCKRVLSELK